MEIDRAKFLFLAASIAACGGGTKPAEVASSTPPPIGPSEPVEKPVKKPDPEPPPCANAEGIGCPAYGDGMPDPPPPDPYYTPSTATPICSGSDDVGTSLSCQLTIDKSCSPFPFVTEACEGANKYMRAKIAERAVSCIRRAKPKELCDAVIVYKCKNDAIHTACPDASADAPCSAMKASCPSIDANECRQYLSGLNAAGRKKMQDCIKSDCSWGLFSCSEGLL